MINFFICSIVAIFSISFFMSTTTMQGVNRTVLMLPAPIFENSLVLYDQNLEEDFEPYFDNDRLSEYLQVYFKENLFRYVDSYKIGIYYFDSETNAPCTLKCQAVTVSVNVTLVGFYDYTKSMTYKVGEGV